MSLLAEAQALTKRAGACGVARLLGPLSESEQAEVHEALAAHVSARALSDAMRERGWVLNYQTITRHRAGVCSCKP